MTSPSPPPWCRVVAGGLELDVWVVPGGSRSGVEGLHGGRLRLAVAAPPEGGKANRAVQRLLADLVGVAPGRVELLRGANGRAKTWRVLVAEPAAVAAVLTAAVAGPPGSAPDGGAGKGVL